MNDDEARYLIDQYDKYTSWSERSHETADRNPETDVTDAFTAGFDQSGLVP
jgi:hypothetical protein